MASADRLIEIFNEAKARPAGAARDGFLADSCGDDAELKAQVLSLLGAHEGAGEFLKAQPALSPEIEAELARLKPEEAGERIGHYKLLQEIGQGGFGTVWMAEQMEPVSRRVALKIIKMGMDTREVIARFESERQALAMMDHPNIAKVFDAGATQFGRPFFVMELVKGIPVTQYCDEAGLGTRERLALFGEVCSAINHAHQKGVIHRDIKPSNVMVTLHGDKPVVKVIDFGIAKATQGRLTDKTLFTRFEQFIGTPVYMSPEQAALSGLDIDTRSDIYALGILLYELLTGKPPFDAKSLASAGYEEMRRIIREVEPPKPSSRISTLAGEERTLLAKSHHIDPEKLNRLVEPDLDWIVMKAIDKDRARRYETANAFARDIAHFLADEPVSATPPSAGYQFRKFARRNKAALRVAAAIAAVLVAATIVSTYQAVRATRAVKKTAETLVQVAAERDAKEVARKDAEDILNFLGEVFQRADPNHDGRTITVAETLDTAAKKLETDLDTQPAQRAKLRATLGTTYFALGLSRQAFPLQEEVRNYYLANAGPEHPDTLQAMQILAISYDDAGRRDEALKLREEVLAIRRKVLGPEHPDTLAAMNNLILSYAAVGRRDEALKLREEVLALRRKGLGPEHPVTLAATEKLMLFYDDTGQKDKALKLQKEVLALRRKVLGPEHRDTLAAINKLMLAYNDVGRQDEALKLCEELLAIRRKVLGPEHPLTLRLKVFHDDVGRKNEALKLCEAVLMLRRKELGPEHRDTLAAIKDLTLANDDAGRKDEALKLREELLELHHKTLGPEHFETGEAQYHLARSYADAGRRDEALKLFKEVLPLRRKALGPEHPNTHLVMDKLAKCHRENGDVARAEVLEKELAAARAKATSPVDSLIAAGRVAEALPLLAESSTGKPGDTILAMKVAALQAWFGLEADHAATRQRMLAWAADTTIPEAANRVAKLACIRPEADPTRREAALALARKGVELGKGTPTAPWHQLSLGMAEFRSGHYPAADAALAAAVQTASTAPGTAPANIEGTANFYRAMTLFHQGKPAEARALFTATEAKMKPLPTDDRNPLAASATQNDLILWLACKEAKALLGVEAKR